MWPFKEPHDDAICRRCGHKHKAHKHYRSGSECSICKSECPRFRRWF